MKDVTLYLDVWTTIPIEQQQLYATASPGVKMDGIKRFAISVKLPNVYEPDEQLPVHEFKEVDIND